MRGAINATPLGSGLSALAPAAGTVRQHQHAARREYWVAYPRCFIVVVTDRFDSQQRDELALMSSKLLDQSRRWIAEAFNDRLIIFRQFELQAGASGKVERFAGCHRSMTV